MIYNAKTTGNKALDSLVQQCNNTGRLAFVQPRKQKISFNGGKSVTYQEAKKHILEFLESEAIA